MKLKNILLSCVFIFGSLSLSGCYTQLAMFYPEPEIENDDSEKFYQAYSMAAPRLNVSAYAQDGAGQSLGLAYQMMYNRFNGFMGFGNRYNYYNPYYNYNGGYYNNSYTLGGYTMYIPYSDIYASGEKKQRTWTTDRGSSTSGTNLNVTRTRSSNTSESNNNGGYSNSSSITRSTSSGTSTNSSSNGGGRRVTKRH
jgi:hypothetical protein